MSRDFFLKIQIFPNPTLLHETMITKTLPQIVILIVYSPRLKSNKKKSMTWNGYQFMPKKDQKWAKHFQFEDLNNIINIFIIEFVF